MFNKFSQRSGCTCVLQLRPRPVYRSLYDADGDCIMNELVGWRCMKYQLFENREDKLSARIVQFEIDAKQAALPEEIQDVYLRYNEGFEVKTKLDTEFVEFNGKKYPLWCFVGEDLEEYSDEQATQNHTVLFRSFSNNVYANV